MKKNVLIFPCGSEIGLEINRALAKDIHFEIFGASSTPDHGKFVYKNYIEGVPFVSCDNFIDSINEICQKYSIDFIIPAHDSVVLKLAQNFDKLSAKIITSPAETCEIARSKKRTYEVLKDTIKCPKIYNFNDQINYPVFIKPDVGQGSKGAKRINGFDELKNEYNNDKTIVISELLTGEEYTIDCFTDKNGKLLFSRGRKRARISNGISVNSYPIKNEKFNDIAKKINSKIKFQGMWFFQLKEDSKGELTLLEIAPRIAGTMGMYRGLGVNFILLALYDAMGYDIKLIENSFDIEIDRALFARYKTNLSYDYIYIDFDDTLICNNEVNTDIIKLLYQAKNKKKKIILISKHDKNISDTLNKFCIPTSIFDKIIHLEKKDKKSFYIKEKSAIFIDDSYAERKDVLDNCKIPVFSIDAIETLLDWKN